MSTDQDQKQKINSFYQDLNQNEPSKFNELIQKHKIDFTTLVPFAQWSNDKYTRVCLNRTEESELLLLCWLPGQSTKIHDHNGQNCQVYFVKGKFQECVYKLDESFTCIATNEIDPGSVTGMNDASIGHSLKNNSNELAITLHYYAKPIEQCALYADDGTDKKEVDLVYDENLSDSNDIVKEIAQFSQITANLIKDEEENPISERIEIKNLKQTIDIELTDEAMDNELFYPLLQKVALATPKTASKLFFNQLFGGRQSKAILGDLLAVVLNNSMYTYKVAGVQVGIEKEILKQVIDRIGYSSDADGTFPTGGSMSNFMAMLMARDKTDVQSRQQGNQDHLIGYTSKESHYSVEKNAAFVGVGRKNIRKIDSDEFGRMKVSKLEEAIAKDIEDGLTPFFINATAGTTVLGAFDPFEEISVVAKKNNTWMHIDGAYTGAVFLSEKYKHLLKGIENSDSFSFNPHKMLGTPMTCSIIVVNNKKHLLDSFSNDAEYLYQTDDDAYNLGKTSFQCGRRNDALKLWTLWKSAGTSGLEKIVDTQFELADFTRNYVKNNPDYTLYSFDESVSICFNYKGIPASDLCTALYEQNELMVGYGHFNDTEFVRMITINATNNESDILRFFKVLEKVGDKSF